MKSLQLIVVRVSGMKEEELTVKGSTEEIMSE